MDKVKKSDLVELKALNAPPQDVKEILAATMTLLGKENARDYRTAKRELGSSTFLKTLSTFDVDSVSVEAAKKANEYIQGITVESVRKVSGASVSMFCWVQDVISQTEQIVIDFRAT
ncbi:Dynein heavy chain 6, axonemal [Mizuhopecten yessoensis]|uniref:Dynein heavy chain 6, axonemal n=1 Tax=Mizuhopecten yessoensis TaxID=6573 RepID=A0A210PTI7_MIZYE|nr:Dynein heavy chain 6, axonemal [Mizuhopecten yessoensis]